MPWLPLSVLQSILDFQEDFLEPFDSGLDFCEAAIGVIRDSDQRPDNAQEVRPINVNCDSVHCPIVGERGRTS